MGKNPCVTFPCLTQLPPLKTAAVSWGSYGWEWSVVGLSVLAHTHTPPADWTSWWAGEWRCPSFHTLHYTTLSLVCSSSCRGASLIVSTHRLLSCLVSRSQERGAVSTIIHIFHTEESSVFQSVFGIWCESSLTHWVLRCCYSRSKLGVVGSLSPMIFFSCGEPFYAQGLCSREGTDSLCWVCVGVLEVRLVLV